MFKLLVFKQTVQMNKIFWLIDSWLINEFLFMAPMMMTMMNFLKLWPDLQKCVYAAKLRFILLHRLIATHKKYLYTVLSLG